MENKARIGIIADYDAGKPSHPATNEAIEHAANYLSVKVDVAWLPTEPLETSEGLRNLDEFDGIWAGPGSPYQSPEGAIRGIQLAREKNHPFFGT